MATYVRGPGTGLLLGPWHWYASCSRWPKAVDETQMERPREALLCKECLQKEQAGELLGFVQLAKYVQGEDTDAWHWCRNCSQWPGKIVRSRAERPPGDLCNQCKAKERDDDCSPERAPGLLDIGRLRGPKG